MLQYDFVTDPERLAGIAGEVVRAPVVGLDIETTSLDPSRGSIRLLQLLVPGEENEGRGRIYVVDLFETKGLGSIEAALRDTKAIFVLHNVKFEQKWFWWHYRLRLWPVFCTFRASALIYNGKKGLRHDLDSVIIRELEEHPQHVGQGGSDWSGRLTQRQRDYAAEDVLRLARLREVLKSKLTRYGLLTAALVEFGVILAEGRTELNGFALNQDKWLALAEANEVERTRMREGLLDILPHPKGQLGLPGMSAGWNVDSPAQVLESLRKLGVKVETTNAIELAQHAKKWRAVRKLLGYRHVAQLVKTYGRKFLRHVDEDGRIRPEYYGLLVTGRYSANKSMQQIPRGPDFRACFEVPEGRRLIGADYSGVEMRMCAEISKDEELTRVFVDGEDVHRATASIVAGVPLESVTKDQRQKAKPCNFGYIFGMMPDKFVLYAMANYGVVVSLAEAKRSRAKYFERYSGVARWHKRMLRDGPREGFSRTLSGRIRYLDPTEAHNEFLNTPIQGSCADALKTSLAIVQDRIDRRYGVTPAGNLDGPVRLVHHVHDEIILEADDDADMVAEVERLLHDGMKEGLEHFMKRVPVVVEPSDGRSWASVH